MNKSKYICAALMAALAIPCSTYAQALHTGYFNDGYQYKHDLNPAKGNEHNYVAIPVLGNLNVGVGANTSITNILFSRNGRTVLFTNPSVTDAEALDGLPTNIRHNVNVSLPVVSVGFKSFGGYNTVELNLRSTVNTRVPKTLFEFVKQGAENKTYDISGLNAQGQGYAELAFGHSRDITEKLRVGAKAKILVGLGMMEAKFNQATLALNEDVWTITSNAELRLNAAKMSFDHKKNETTKNEYVSGVNTDNTSFNIAGFGAAIDLGAVYKVDDNWEVSGAITDLGFISWSKTKLALTQGDRTFTSDKYTFSTNDDDANSFKHEGDRLKDDLGNLYQMNDLGEESTSRMLGANINVGASYKLDAVPELTFGLLSSSYLHGKFSSTEGRLSANYALNKKISASVSGGYGTYGPVFGWLINLSYFHIGMDNSDLRLIKPGVPKKSLALNMGFNVVF